MLKASEKFLNYTNGRVIRFRPNLKISFNKKRKAGANWLTLDSSVLNGDDLLATNEENTTQVWDAYDYQDISERLVNVNVARGLEFPYGVQASALDVKLNNYDGYLTFANMEEWGNGRSKSPVADYILPSRPIRLFLRGCEKLHDHLPIFVGTTKELPKYNHDSGDYTIDWSALDYLSEIADKGLIKGIKLINATTDEVIKEILNQFGMTTEQYSLEKGQNEIPFVYIEHGQKTGDILKKLVQAENGKLWLDERGVIRFANRSSTLDKEPVMRLNASNIIELKNSQLTGLINKVSIKSEVRKVLERQKVYEMENNSETGSSSSNKKNHEWQIAPRGGTYTAWIKLDDPCWEIEAPRLDYSGGSSRFEANIIGLKDQEVPRGIEATGWLLGDTYKIDFVNNSTYNAYISKIELYGRPAKVVDTIIYEAADNSSIKKYGTHSLEINDNNFLGKRRNCEALARDILQQNSEYNPEIEAEIKPCPALALGDTVAVDYANLGDYTVVKISQSYGADGDKMTLKLRRTSRAKTFVLDISLLDGRDMLG